MVKEHAGPTPAQVIKARITANLTQQQAADLVYVTPGTWLRWEGGSNARRMPKAAWELFGIKTRKMR